MAPKAQIALSLLASAALVASAAIAQPVREGGRTFTATLTGAAEVPSGTGDPDGSGTATIFINPGQKRLCYEITVSNLEGVFASHIHFGAAGEEPPNNIVIGLTGAFTGSTSGCVPTTGLTSRTLAQILAKPSQYYVNVHDSDNPDGAVRGQLVAQK